MRDPCIGNDFYLNSDVYSIEADMLTGWKPKTQNIIQIPLDFESRFDKHFENVRSQGSCSYSGFRPEDSFELHRSFANKNSYFFKLP